MGEDFDDLPMLIGELMNGNRSGFTVLTCLFLVELPGIELVTEMALRCENADVIDAKVRESC
jgi:hypothetical protein